MIHQNKTLNDIFTEDPDFWDSFPWPEGIEGSAVQLLIAANSGTLCPMIQDAGVLKIHARSWATYRSPDWLRMLAALTAEYNPIHNYFKEELGEEEIAKHHGTKRSNNYKDTYKQGNVITNTGSVMAYDSTTESETGQSVSTPSGDGDVRSGLAADNYEIIEDASATSYDRDVHGFNDRVTQGNVGVTRTQEMIDDELRLRAEKSLTEMIAAEFEDKFLIQCY